MILRKLMPYFCYILECCDGTFYTGWTTDPQRRTKTHNAGRGARYTRTRTPVQLVYTEELPDRAAAMKREIAIKRMDHSRKAKLIKDQSQEN
ncbi:MAG: GIY-YIG nuclease family protein [Anaerolineales bacterium]